MVGQVFFNLKYTFKYFLIFFKKNPVFHFTVVDLEEEVGVDKKASAAVLLQEVPEHVLAPTQFAAVSPPAPAIISSGI